MFWSRAVWTTHATSTRSKLSSAISNSISNVYGDHMNILMLYLARYNMMPSPEAQSIYSRTRALPFSIDKCLHTLSLSSLPSVHFTFTIETIHQNYRQYKYWSTEVNIRHLLICFTFLTAFLKPSNFKQFHQSDFLSHFPVFSADAFNHSAIQHFCGRHRKKLSCKQISLLCSLCSVRR